MLVVALLACNLGGSTAAPPTPSVFPTVSVPPSAGPTVTVVATLGPTAAPAASNTPLAATDTPASAASPTPASTAPADQEVILILEPGPLSSVTSPVHVAGEADPTFEQNLVIQVTGEDGQVLATMPTTIQADAGQRGPFAADVTFTVASAEPGRISVYSTSARDGGLVHLASAEVTLLASGSATLNPAKPHTEVHQLFQPAPLANIAGGTVHLEGFSEYVFESTLGLALCGEGGSGAPDKICGTVDNVLASGSTLMEAPDIGQPGPFQADIAYSVSGPTHARVVIYSASARDGGLLHLTSREVTLAP